MKKYILTALFSAVSLLLFSQVQDSTVMLESFTVMAAKEQSPWHDLPVTSYSLNEKNIEKEQINSLKDASAVLPNFYIPDYGSKITSSVYVRGISSRMNEPSVGLYVDGIPYLDKSCFDFDFYDIASLTLLQGPQGTLYGRNSIGGLLKINTLSPLDYQGTKWMLSYGNYNDIKAKGAYYGKLNDKIGISAAGYYNSNDGYFTNIYDGEKNNSQDFGGRAKLDWKLPAQWRANLNLAFDHTSQNAYPYAAYDTITQKTGDINYNEDGSYWRNMATAGLNLQRIGDKVLFTSSTGFQYLNDEMRIDQDFTATPVLALLQHQNEQIVTQEFVFRSNDHKRYEWVTGAFGFYKGLNVDAPITFRSGGIAMIQTFLDKAKQENPRMPKITITNPEMVISGDFKTPSYGVALYHQSTYNFNDKLSVTAGLRLDYEKSEIDYYSSGTLNTTVTIALPPPRPSIITPKDSTYILEGNTSQDFLQLLPKLAVKYKFNEQNNIYASVAKGYKAGGYNYSMFSDIVREQMQNKKTSDIENKIAYQPEYSWNYEIGVHTEPVQKRLFVDAAVFFIDDYNQQMATSSSSGSRMITNADKVRSYGVDLNASYKIIDEFSVNAAYGYTHSSFASYVDTLNHVDYSGKYVPFVPQNTLSIGAAYDLKINKKWLDKIGFSAQYVAVGKIYWNEDNSLYQDFYGLLNGEISFTKKNFELTGWIKNALNQEYNTFYFESLGNSFVQQGKPVAFGGMIRYSF